MMLIYSLKERLFYKSWSFREINLIEKVLLVTIKVSRGTSKGATAESRDAARSTVSASNKACFALSSASVMGARTVKKNYFKIIIAGPPKRAEARSSFSSRSPA